MTEKLRAFLRAKVWSYVLVALLAFGLGALLFRTAAHVSHDHARHQAGTEPSPQAATWTCAMHPQIRQPEPGQCPICGMDLIPVHQTEGGELAPHQVTLSERARVLAELRTTAVRRQVDPSAELRLLGRVEPNEEATRIVTAWVGGRIDRLHVRVTGERVRRGQTIATLYSPEVLAAHQDLIAARRQADRMRGATEGGRTAAQAALEAARDRLRLLGISEERLENMETESQPARQIAIQSPFSGTVLERLTTEGSYVATGEPLYRIVDLSRVWVQLDAYEQDLPALQVGHNVRVDVESLPGEPFEGRIAFIDPTLDRVRRTARVRVEVANPEGRLRPGMFAHAIVQGSLESGKERPLVIPRSAPLFTGRRSIVYVEKPGAKHPTYEARVVRLGPRAGDVYPVVAGLTEGERIVYQGAFVLDADLQIRGGTSMMASPDDTEQGPWDEVIALPVTERRKLKPVLEHYLQLQRALARDDLPDAKAAAKTLERDTSSIQLATPQVAKEAWPQIASPLREHARHMAEATSLEAIRGAFEGATAEVKKLLRRFGNPLDRTVQTAFCPMASGHGAWIQEGTEIDNPYFGAAMRACGDIRDTLPPGAYLPKPDPSRPPPPPTHEGHRH